MRLVGSNPNLKEVTVNDSAPVPRDKDGTFHVPETVGKALVKSGDFAQAERPFATARAIAAKTAASSRCSLSAGADLLTLFRSST